VVANTQSKIRHYQFSTKSWNKSFFFLYTDYIGLASNHSIQQRSLNGTFHHDFGYIAQQVKCKDVESIQKFGKTCIYALTIIIGWLCKLKRATLLYTDLRGGGVWHVTTCPSASEILSFSFYLITISTHSPQPWTSLVFWNMLLMKYQYGSILHDYAKAIRKDI